MPEPKTPGPWIVGHPGGPAGPFWSLVNAEGNVVAMQIVEEADARAMATIHELRRVLWQIRNLEAQMVGGGRPDWAEIGREACRCAREALTMTAAPPSKP